MTTQPKDLMALEEVINFIQVELREEKKLSGHFVDLPPWRFIKGIHDRQIEASLKRQSFLQAALQMMEAGRDNARILNMLEGTSIHDDNFRRAYWLFTVNEIESGFEDDDESATAQEVKG